MAINTDADDMEAEIAEAIASSMEKHGPRYVDVQLAEDSENDVARRSDRVATVALPDMPNIVVNTSQAQARQKDTPTSLDVALHPYQAGKISVDGDGEVTINVHDRNHGGATLRWVALAGDAWGYAFDQYAAIANLAAHYDVAGADGEGVEVVAARVAGYRGGPMGVIRADEFLEFMRYEVDRQALSDLGDEFSPGLAVERLIEDGEVLQEETNRIP